MLPLKFIFINYEHNSIYYQREYNHNSDEARGFSETYIHSLKILGKTPRSGFCPEQGEDLAAFLTTTQIIDYI